MAELRVSDAIIFEILKNDEMCYIKNEICGKCIKAISKFILIIS